MTPIARRMLHLTSREPDAPALDFVSNYSGDITTTAFPGSIEQSAVPTMGRRVRTRLGQSVAYTLTSFPVAVVWIIAVGSIFGTIFSLALIGVGLLLLPFALRATSLAGHIERWMLLEIFDERIDPPLRAPREPGVRGVILGPIKDASYWKELAFVSMRMILAPMSLFLFLGSLAVGLFGTSVLVWGWFADIETEVTFIWLIAGLVSLVICPLLVMAMTSFQLSLARALLGLDRAALTSRAHTAARNRDLSVAAAEAERQRIERDLHDGAQARLATVALDLGRAKRRLEKQGGDQELGAMIDSAHRDAKEAIVELRNLARGIHPAVLTDRGLDAALSDVAARCAVPVHLDVHMLERPAAHIESAAYFAVCELLTNITKHSRASQAWVTVRGDSAHIRIDVSDNGLGGADHALGSGLLGLHERITGIDGTFSTDSPLAGGTRALIEIPMQPQTASPVRQCES